MNVYRDEDGKPVLVGSCSLVVPPSGLVPTKIDSWRRVQDPTDSINFRGPRGGTRIVLDEWESGLVQDYGIKLRATDDPQSLPGWTPLVRD